MKKVQRDTERKMEIYEGVFESHPRLLPQTGGLQKRGRMDRAHVLVMLWLVYFQHCSPHMKIKIVRPHRFAIKIGWLNRNKILLPSSMCSVSIMFLITTSYCYLRCLLFFQLFAFKIFSGINNSHWRTSFYSLQGRDYLLLHSNLDKNKPRISLQLLIQIYQSIFVVTGAKGLQYVA